MVEVFDLCREVLADDGTAWVNMGDSYASNAGGYDPLGSPGLGIKRQAAVQRGDRQGQRSGLKPKDLVGQPWRLAFALQDAGWYLRQDIIWHKPNPMPESIRDRCTKAHEYVFLLSKSERYFYDFEAMQEPVSGTSHARVAQNVAAQKGSDRAYGGIAGKPMKAVLRKPPSGWDTGPGGHRDLVGRYVAPDPGVGRRATKQTNGVGWGYTDGAAAKPRTRKQVDGEDTGDAYADGKGDRLGRGPGWRKLALAGSGTKLNESYDAAIGSGDLVSTRNRRSVWTVPSEPYSGAHFATFPRALIHRSSRAAARPPVHRHRVEQGE
jgi:hypothetical protein